MIAGTALGDAADVDSFARAVLHTAQAAYAVRAEYGSAAGICNIALWADLCALTAANAFVVCGKFLDALGVLPGKELAFKRKQAAFGRLFGAALCICLHSFETV